MMIERIREVGSRRNQQLGGAERWDWWFCAGSDASVARGVFRRKGHYRAEERLVEGLERLPGARGWEIRRVLNTCSIGETREV
jgi:hypothetical protein